MRIPGSGRLLAAFLLLAPWGAAAQQQEALVTVLPNQGWQPLLSTAAGRVMTNVHVLPGAGGKPDRYFSARTFQGGAKLPVDQLLAMLQGQRTGGCPGLEQVEATRGGNGVFEVTTVTWVCRTCRVHGKSEFITFRVIRGQASLYVLEFSSYGAPLVAGTPLDDALSEHRAARDPLFKEAVVCTGGPSGGGCSG